MEAQKPVLTTTLICFNQKYDFSLNCNENIPSTAKIVHQTVYFFQKESFFRNTSLWSSFRQMKAFLTISWRFSAKVRQFPNKVREKTLNTYHFKKCFSSLGSTGNMVAFFINVLKSFVKTTQKSVQSTKRIISWVNFLENLNFLKKIHLEA